MPIAYPYRFSDWYGYDKDCSTLTSYSSSVVGVFNQACPFDGSTRTLSQTYYHDGSGSLPTTGDTCYSDSAGTSTLAAGYYNINTATGVGNRLYIQIGSGGVVQFPGQDYC